MCTKLIYDGESKEMSYFTVYKSDIDFCVYHKPSTKTTLFKKTFVPLLKSKKVSCIRYKLTDIHFRIKSII